MPDPIDAARSLADLAASLGPDIESSRRLPPVLLEQLVATGMFRILTPASLGGLETDLDTFVQLIETIAQADASTAWCVGQAASGGFAAVRLPRSAAERIFGDPTTIVAWGPGSGEAVPGPDGFTVTARATFASGCRHATWLGVQARVVDDPSSSVRLFLVPREAVAFDDVWHVSGLRGTASDSYGVADVVVPEEHTFSMVWPAREQGRLYAFPVTTVYGITFAAVALGIARGALDAFAELATKKTARSASSPLREGAVVQSQYARAEASVRAARAFLLTSVATAWASTGGPDRPTSASLVDLRLATTHAIHTSATAVDVVYHAAGSTAILNTEPFERRFRDIHAVTQQIQGSQTQFERTGRALLGLDDAEGFA